MFTRATLKAYVSRLRRTADHYEELLANPPKFLPPDKAKDMLIAIKRFRSDYSIVTIAIKIIEHDEDVPALLERVDGIVGRLDAWVQKLLQDRRLKIQSN